MKGKILKILTSILFLCLSLGLFTACDETSNHIHNFNQQIAVHKYFKQEVSCINDGLCYYSCVCGEKGTKTYIYAKANGHRYSNYNSYTDATCEENATKIGYCSSSNCKEKIIIEVENTALGHNYDNYVYNNDASCEENGTETSFCSRDGCNEKHTRIKENSLLNHKFLYYFSDGNATYEEDGTKTATCENPNCNKIDTVIDEGSKLVLYHTIKIVYNNTSYSDKTINVKDGETLSTPSDPWKRNYLFTGWYTTSGLYNKYDFSQPVTKDFSIYAGYEIDAVKLTNEISTNHMKGIVKVYNKSYNTFLGIETSSATSQGSGFCFNISNGYYYILTNCHVAQLKEDYEKQKYIIEDYQGNTYTGYLYSNAISSKYDLACLYFKPSSSNVIALDLEYNNAKIDDDVISLGAPEGQSNTITFGKVYNYYSITLSNTPTYLSNVKFDVMVSNAYAYYGSSGGPMLNSDLNIVGVNYAISKNLGITYSIPLEKIKEFLRKYVYN